jgi:predicted nucleotidyltransferase component of viral defense system
MITQEQIYLLSKKKRIAETIVFREYLQLLFLKELYSQKQSKNIFFKGGTALHLIYKAPRFSEDLGFTVELKEKIFLDFVWKLFDSLSKKETVNFKERKTITGKKFLLTAAPTVLPYKTFVNLEFSFREKVLSPQKSIIESDYPVLFTSYLYHLSKEEIFAEKIRALLIRTKGRDLYDLWYLLTRGAGFEQTLVKEKLKYYHLENINSDKIWEKIKRISKKDFILDLRPFVPIDEREKLGDFFNYIKDYLQKHLILRPPVNAK